MAIEYSRSASSSVNDDPWAATQQHAAVACLQGVMSALHPELRRFVRVCVREHVLKGMPMRNAMSSAKYGEIDRQVTTLLDTKLPKMTAATADFVAYLTFVDQNWYKYVADLDFHGDLRAIVKQSVEIRNKVAHQVPMTAAEYEQALKVFHRFADLLAVQKTTKDLIAALIESADIEVTATRASSSSSSSSSSESAPTITVRSKKTAKVGVQMWTIVALCWVVLALLWTIMVLQDDDARNPVKPWIPRLSLWDLSFNLKSVGVLAPAPAPEAQWSLLSSLKAFVPAAAPPQPTPEPLVAATSWLGGWL